MSAYLQVGSFGAHLRGLFAGGGGCLTICGGAGRMTCGGGAGLITCGGGGGA